MLLRICIATRFLLLVLVVYEILIIITESFFDNFDDYSIFPMLITVFIQTLFPLKSV